MGEPAQVNAARMSGGVFPALGVQPLLGRVFTQEEDEQQQQVAVLSYATWQSRFQGDPKILGKKILLDRKPYVVIGVMPRNFEFPLHAGPSEPQRTVGADELYCSRSWRRPARPTGATTWSGG